MVKIVKSPIIPEAFAGMETGGAGSVLLHYAVVKEEMCPEGAKSTCSIEYRETGDAASELEGICGEIKTRWNIKDLTLVRRVGRLHVNDIISLVAISSSRSEDAFEACRYGLGRLKKMATIMKEEIFR